MLSEEEVLSFIKKDVISNYKSDSGETNEWFDDEAALAVLLLDSVIFINSCWFKEGWPDDAKESTYLGVSCNDIFAWGCSDAEDLPYEELRSLYDHYIKDPVWGSAIWCMKKRKEMPQRPVEAEIRLGGIWDLNTLKTEFNLRPNCYDGISHILAKLKYDTYSQWKKDNGEKPIIFDSNWWEGWKEYTLFHPDWYSNGWKISEDDAINTWKKENGWF